MTGETQTGKKNPKFWIIYPYRRSATYFSDFSCYSNVSYTLYLISTFLYRMVIDIN